MFLQPAPPRVLAHRGLAIEAPENTLPAFAYALSAGVRHIETDVRASRDGEAVLCHDESVLRLAGVDRPVAELTMAELRGLALGAGVGLCSLREALDAFPDARFNLDVKSADAVQPTVRAVRDARAIDRVLVTSFSERRRRATVSMLPGVATSASAPRFVAALLGAASGAGPIVRRALRGLQAVQAPERALGLTVTSPRVIAALHKAGVELHIWTVNDPARMRTLWAAGIDGIVTDRADLALGVLRTWRNDTGRGIGASTGADV